MQTLLGHKQGIWCVNYHPSGAQLVTASPEGIAKIWDIKSGKSLADLKVHTKKVRTNSGIIQILGLLGYLRQFRIAHCNLW